MAYVIICNNEYQGEIDSFVHSYADDLTEAETELNVASSLGYSNCNIYTYLVTPDDLKGESNTTIDVLIEPQPSIDGTILETDFTTKNIKDVFNFNLQSQELTTSSKKITRYSRGLDSSPKFTRSEFDLNLSNITRSVNKNAITLSQLVTNDIYQYQKLNSYEDVTTGSTTSIVNLWEKTIPLDSVQSLGDSIELKASGNFSLSNNLKSIKFKISDGLADEVLMYNYQEEFRSKGIETIINWKAEMDIVKSATNSVYSSGSIMFNGISVEVTNTKVNIDWFKDLTLSIVGQVTQVEDTVIDDDIVIHSVIVKLPRRNIVAL